MGLFGPSKKEKALQAEVERLSNLMLPEHREIDTLNKQIEVLKSEITNLEKTINEDQKKDS
jgi:peptidoglycan hydrolase CwlO-like protein